MNTFPFFGVSLKYVPLYDFTCFTLDTTMSAQGSSFWVTEIFSPGLYWTGPSGSAVASGSVLSSTDESSVGSGVTSTGASVGSFAAASGVATPVPPAHAATANARKTMANIRVTVPPPYVGTGFGDTPASRPDYSQRRTLCMA